MNPNDALLQYGALGVLALLCVLAVRTLFNREVEAHKRDAERADRLEQQLKSLNETIQNQYLTTIAQATMAISEALNIVREIDNERKKAER